MRSLCFVVMCSKKKKKKRRKSGAASAAPAVTALLLCSRLGTQTVCATDRELAHRRCLAAPILLMGTNRYLCTSYFYTSPRFSVPAHIRPCADRTVSTNFHKRIYLSLLLFLLSLSLSLCSFYLAFTLFGNTFLAPQKINNTVQIYRARQSNAIP